MTVLERLEQCGYQVVERLPVFHDKNTGERDRLIAIKAPNGEISKLTESGLAKQYPEEFDAPEL